MSREIPPRFSLWGGNDHFITDTRNKSRWPGPWISAQSNLQRCRRASETQGQQVMRSDACAQVAGPLGPAVLSHTSRCLGCLKVYRFSLVRGDVPNPLVARYSHVRFRYYA